VLFRHLGDSKSKVHIHLPEEVHSRIVEISLIMDEFNHVSTPTERNFKLTSKEGNEFEDATKYIQLMGSIIYLTTTKTNISFVVGIPYRLQKPCERHWSVAKEF
jgi:hypothetical protein